MKIDSSLIGTDTFQIEDTARKNLTQLKKGIKFEARGHPLSNYAKGREEGGIKMRNRGEGLRCCYDLSLNFVHID